MTKMRTINQAIIELKTEDPGTCLTRNALRQMVLTGKVSAVMVGSKYLLNMEALQSYLNSPTPQQDSQSEYGKIRRIN